MAALTQSQNTQNNSRNIDKDKEIGNLLLKVQDDLKNLRTLISKDGSKVDIKVLQTNIQKAEEEIKQKSDYLINQINNQVQIIPFVGENDEVPVTNYSAPIENLWNFNKKEKNMVQSKSQSLNSRPETNQAIQIVSKNKEKATYEDDDLIDEIYEIKNSKITPYTLSPGQMAKVNRETKILFNPENPLNRTALTENYNLQLPLIEKKEKLKMSTHIITGSTIDHLATLPLTYRRNPTLIPPPVDEDQAKYGILSLMERGLIPPSSKITFDQFPMSTKPVKSDEINDENKTIAGRFKTNELVYKLDPNYDPSKIKSKENVVTSKKMPAIGEREKSSLSSDRTTISKKKIESFSRFKHSASVAQKEKKTKAENELHQPPATPLNTLQLQLYDSSKFVHKFVIQFGRVRTDMAEFNSYKQSFILRWGSIITIIRYLEEICDRFSIPVGIVDGSKVSELSRCVDMDLKPTEEELVDTFLNKEDIQKLIKSPGQRFKGKDGRDAAATKIQATWKGHRDRIAYVEYRKRKWAAGVIALTWLTYVKISKSRDKLRITRAKQLENFRIRQKEFIRNWPKIRESRRIIIHIPSLAYSEAMRDKMRDFQIRENYQMSRICDIADKNVDVIYVSPLQLNEETLQYYLKLFSLRTAKDNANTSEQINYGNRYKIVVPEALNSFPTHNMALSTLLKYSPKAIERIKNLIKGREAYMVSGVMSHDDIYISDILNVPILGSEPEVGNLYSTKSGSKRIFQSAKVFTPYGEFDIYNKEQLYECLAQAITENLIVQRWLFKLDDEFDGRGIAYCDISKHLSCYNWALKEMIKFGDKWGKRWAYEPTYVKILEEIPDVLDKFAQPANKDVFPSWEVFLSAFLARGGILEAHPPSDSVTSLTVTVLIEPNLNVKIISSSDHLHATSQYSCWGYTFPQTSVDPKLLNETCLKIAESCKQRNIIGYVDIDFVTFVDPKTDNQILWATDLNISYTDHMALSSLLFYLTNGHFDSESHLYEVSNSDSNDDVLKLKKSKRHLESIDRYAVMSTKLHHSNLSVIHYSVFFQTCRALGIGYDIKEKQGTIFTLVDSYHHVNMGMLTVSDNLRTAMQLFAHNLNALHKEISSEGMQGKTNFLLASDDIQKILEMTNETNDESNNS